MAKAQRNVAGGQEKAVYKLDTPTGRAKVPSDPEPYWCHLAPGLALGYHKPKKGAGTWRVRVYLPASKKLAREVLGVADDMGKDAADGERVLTYKEAQDKARKRADEILDGVKREAGGEVLPKGLMTVDDALDFYFADCERRGVKGLSSDRQRAAAWIRPELGTVGVDTLSRERIESWMAWVANAPKRVRTPAPGAHVPTPRKFKVPRKTKEKPAPPSPTPDDFRKRKDSANRVLTTLKAALNFALDRNRVRCTGAAWRKVKPFENVSKARVRFLSREEQVRLINACKGGFQDLVKAALLTGARYGELARILVLDFNAQAGTVFVNESKSGKARHIVLGDEGVALFTELTAGRGASEHVFVRGDSVMRRTRDELGNLWGHSDQRREMGLACKAAGLDRLVFHELRHSYASGLVNSGVPLAFVAAQLGHASTVMVERHYGHLAPSALAESIRKLQPKLGLPEQAKVNPLKIG